MRIEFVTRLDIRDLSKDLHLTILDSRLSVLDPLYLFLQYDDRRFWIIHVRFVAQHLVALLLVVGLVGGKLRPNAELDQVYPGVAGDLLDLLN